MKKLPLPLFLLATLAITSCASIKSKIPEVKKSASEKITAAIAKTGECVAVDQIKMDVNKLLKIESDEGMVAKAIGSSAPKAAQKEGVVSDICKAAAKLAIPALLSNGVPKKWECAMTDLSGKVTMLADEACGKINL